MKRVVDKIIHEEEGVAAFWDVAFYQTKAQLVSTSAHLQNSLVAGADADDAGHQDPVDVCADDAGTVVGAARCSLK